MTLLKRVGTAGRDDPAMVAAHCLLEHLEPSACPPLDRIRVTALPEDDVAQTEGEVITDIIFISSTGTAYQSATSSHDASGRHVFTRGALLPLVALLRHEFHHLRYPAATEGDVRTADLAFARAHGSPDFMVHVCESTLNWARYSGDAALLAAVDDVMQSCTAQWRARLHGDTS
jgi:hypothetical protein